MLRQTAVVRGAKCESGAPSCELGKNVSGGHLNIRAAPRFATFAHLYIMAHSTEFFSEFQPVSKADWLARISKDLKGKALDELYWQLSGALRVDPFGHADDFPELPAPLNAGPLQWEICEDIDAADPAAANAQALEALNFGAESLCFQLTEPASSAFLRTLLEGVHPDFISLQFAGPGLAKNPGAVLATLEALAAERGLDPRALRGALRYDPAAAEGLQDWRYVADLLAYGREHFPGFTLLSVEGAGEWQGAAGVADELAALLKRANHYFKQFADRGMNPADAARALQLTVAVGASYFVEIAKLRALKLLWLNLLKAWGLPTAYPPLDVRFAPDAYAAEEYSNLIRATTMAMSAVLGGADRLAVRPFDAGTDAPSRPAGFGRRMARNVQHLLKMESFFTELHDPAAGSYYVEKLTLQLAEAAWTKFQAD